MKNTAVRATNNRIKRYWIKLLLIKSDGAVKRTGRYAGYLAVLEQRRNEGC